MISLKTIRVSLPISVIFISLFLFAATAEKGCSIPHVRMITKDDLKAWLGEPGLAIIDVRIDKSWDLSDKIIKGAVHENPDDVKAWSGKYPKDKKIVLYCA